MRHVRTAIAAALALSLVAAFSTGPAQAAGTGVGTGSAETTVIAVDLGTNGALLGVKLLADNARSTIDPKTASAAEAFSRLTSVNVSSATVPELNKTDPTLESRQPGGEKEVTKGSVNLSHPSTDPDVPIPSEVVTGTLGFATLASEAAAAAAKSSLTATLTNASVAGALTTVKGVTSSLMSSASSTASEATRNVKVDQVVVLDLSALLEGLDLALSDLSVETVEDLLAELELDVPNVGAADAVEAAVDELETEIATVNGQIDTLNDDIDTVQGEIDGLGSTMTLADLNNVVATVNGLGQGTLIDGATLATLVAGLPSTSGLVTVLNGILGDLQDQVDALQATLADLRDQLADLLGDVLQVLDGAPLLTVDGVEANIVTKAADTLANSTATKTAQVGSLSVGGRTITGVDLKATTDLIESKEALVNSTISDVTEDIDPGLASLVTTDLFAPATNTPLTTLNGYVKATVGVTVLTVKVTPPAELASIISTIDSTTTSIGEQIDALGGSVPDVAAEMKKLQGMLDGTVSVAAAGGVRAAALSETTAVANGATFRVAQVLGTSEFAVGATGFPGSGINPSPGTGTGTTGGPDTGRSLPATGTDSIPLTAFALFLVALGLGFRQWVHMPVPARVRAIHLRLPNRMR